MFSSLFGLGFGCSRSFEIVFESIPPLLSSLLPLSHPIQLHHPLFVALRLDPCLVFLFASLEILSPPHLFPCPVLLLLLVDVFAVVLSSTIYNDVFSFKLLLLPSSKIRSLLLNIFCPMMIALILLPQCVLY